MITYVLMTQRRCCKAYYAFPDRDSASEFGMELSARYQRSSDPITFWRVYEESSEKKS